LKNSRSSFHPYRYLRLLLVAVGIRSCLFAIRAAATYGFSHILIRYAFTAGDLSAAKKAIQLTPREADAHFASGALLSFSGSPQQGIIELENAVALRPADARLWSELGLLRDQTGDTAGALAAFDEAVKHAPYYSEPRWNRGNVLLRKGEYEAAFNDLNQAAQSNPELLPNLMDLAWSVARGDVKLTEQLAQVKGAQMRIAFARLLVLKGKGKEALTQFADAGSVAEPIRLELVEKLLSKGAFSEAFDIWKTAPGVGGNTEAGRPAIYDGGFEGPLSFDQGGFNWRVPRSLQATTVGLDSGRPHSGAKDLKIEFAGESNPTALVVGQLILLEPGKPDSAAAQSRSSSRRYQVNFYARSQDVVSGGLPYINISDASGIRKRLGQSASLGAGTHDWQPFSFEFTTTPETVAVILSLQREGCTTSPCPIFGTIYLDSFSLEELK